MASQGILQLAEDDNSFDKEHVSILKVGLEKLSHSFEGIAFCLSEINDLLSQWRGYADNAKGVSIGFAYDYLYSLCGKGGGPNDPSKLIHKVSYKASEHNLVLVPLYKDIKKRIIELVDATKDSNCKQEEIEKLREEVNDAILRLATYNYRFKSYAFREELEWRLYSYRMHQGDFDVFSYRYREDSLIPYLEVSLLEIPSLTSVVEVILGPKNMSPPTVVGDFLEKNGFKGVGVKQSEASYR